MLSNVALVEYPRAIYAEPGGWFGWTGPCSTRLTLFVGVKLETTHGLRPTDFRVQPNVLWINGLTATLATDFICSSHRDRRSDPAGPRCSRCPSMRPVRPGAFVFGATGGGLRLGGEGGTITVGGFDGRNGVFWSIKPISRIIGSIFRPRKAVFRAETSIHALKRCFSAAQDGFSR